MKQPDGIYQIKAGERLPEWVGLGDDIITTQESTIETKNGVHFIEGEFLFPVGEYIQPHNVRFKRLQSNSGYLPNFIRIK